MDFGTLNSPGSARLSAYLVCLLILSVDLFGTFLEAG